MGSVRYAADLAAVRAAAQGLHGIVRCTPLETCRLLGERVGGEVLLKCENRQRTGSFKLRGAYHRLSRLTAQERASGVVAASAGNHAQGVALAARLLGIRARVYMPSGAALPKVEATRGYGAEVMLTGTGVHDALAAAQEHAGASGAVLVHPFDHPDVIAGQGTVALELVEQCAELGVAPATVLVPVGGGGLVGGIAVALHELQPETRLVGVQAAGAAAFPPSLSAGVPVALASMATMADGIAVAQPGEHTFPIVRDLVDEVVTVGEEQISQALLLLLERAKGVVEPAGAVGVAALLDRGLASGLEPPVVVVLSGGNVDPLLLLRVISHGMAAAGRYLELRLRLPDRPGALAALLIRLADDQANVIEIEHVRSGPRTAIGEVEVEVRLEMRGHEHATELVGALTEAGYSCTVG